MGLPGTRIDHLTEQVVLDPIISLPPTLSLLMGQVVFVATDDAAVEV